MSTFQNYTYDDDNGVTHLLRAQSTLITGVTPANISGVGTVKSNIKVKVSKSNREFGIRPRGVVLQRSIPVNQNGIDYAVNLYHFLPILNKANYDGPNFADGAPVAWNGNNWQVISRRPEDY